MEHLTSSTNVVSQFQALRPEIAANMGGGVAVQCQNRRGIIITIIKAIRRGMDQTEARLRLLVVAMAAVAIMESMSSAQHSKFS